MSKNLYPIIKVKSGTNASLLHARAKIAKKKKFARRTIGIKKGNKPA
jgi:hypothetical protein